MHTTGDHISRVSPTDGAIDEAVTAGSGAVAVLETLRRWQIDRIFMCPGSTEVALLDASRDFGDIELVLATHESVAVAMADGYARAMGRPAVAYLHTNVGLTNGLSHLHAAQVASSPVVVLTGLKSTAIQNGRAFTSNPWTRDLARPFCKWAWQTLRPEALSEDVDRALRLACSTPAGPTFLGLPQDLLETEGPLAVVGAPDAVALGHRGRSRPAEADLDAAVEVLTAARRPLIVAGADVEVGGAVDELLALVERLGAPLMLEDRRNLRGATVPTDHPNYVGLLDRDGGVLAGSDTVLLAGVRAFTEFEASDRPPLSAGRRLVHLHTAREELVRTHPNDVGLLGDAAPALAALREALDDPDVEVAAERGTHLDAARKLRADDLARLAQLAQPSSDGVLRVAAVMAALVSALPGDAVVVADAVTSEPALLERLPLRRPGDYYASGGSGSLGWGMGAALGVALADRSRPVVNVVGDGVVQFGVPALWTAVRQGLRLVVIVINNSSYAAVRSAMVRHGGRSAANGEFPATDIGGVDIAAVARGFGFDAWRVTTTAELDAALETAFVADGAALIEVMTDPDEIGSVSRHRTPDRA